MGTAEEAAWHEERRQGIGGSDACIIMQTLPPEWGRTPWKLWALKRGLLAPEPPNPAMERGTRLEPVARDAYEAVVGGLVMPARLRHPHHPWMVGNLDGLSPDGKLVLEVKCPGRESHEKALKGEVPAAYYPQVQHYLAVSGADRCHYWSFDGEKGALVVVERDSAYIAKLIDAERAFWALVESGTEPELTDRDVVERQDDEWLLAAALYREHEARVVESEALLKAAREKLLSLANGTPRVRGGGVLLTRYTTKGAVDYKKIPALKGLDLDPFRGPDKTAFRVSLEKKLEGHD